MKNRKVLDEMLRIFGYPKKDWMGYKISKKNYISYHHILEKRNDGEETIDNGALLSRTSHQLLHKIELINYDLYLEWQCLFLDLNNLKRPLTENEYAKIGALKNETKNFFASLNNNSTLLLTRELK